MCFYCIANSVWMTFVSIIFSSDILYMYSFMPHFGPSRFWIFIWIIRDAANTWTQLYLNLNLSIMNIIVACAAWRMCIARFCHESNMRFFRILPSRDVRSDCSNHVPASIVNRWMPIAELPVVYSSPLRRRISVNKYFAMRISLLFDAFFFSSEIHMKEHLSFVFLSYRSVCNITTVRIFYNAIIVNSAFIGQTSHIF